MKIIASEVHVEQDFRENTPVDSKLHLPLRSRFLDGLRGFAALYVAFHHAYCTIWRPVDFLGSPVIHRPTGDSYYLAAPFFLGDVAVALFIAISGFSLTIPV